MFPYFMLARDRRPTFAFLIVSITSLIILPRRIADLLENNVRKIIMAFDGVNCKEDLDYLNFRVKNLLNVVLRCNELYEVDAGLIAKIQQAAALTEKSFEESSIPGYQAPKQRNGEKGRPAYIINKSKLEYYLENNFSISLIAKTALVINSCIFVISVNF